MQPITDAFVTMLLVSQLSTSRVDDARPLTCEEYHRLRRQVEKLPYMRLNRLMNTDVNTLKSLLKLSEDQAFRICLLLSRSLLLEHQKQQFENNGIHIMTYGEDGYPKRLDERLENHTPPLLYYCGDTRLAGSTSAAILGNTCSRQDVLECADELSRILCRNGITLVTGGENGFGKLIERNSLQYDGSVVSFIGGQLSEHIYQSGLCELIAMKRALVMSMVHPDAEYTTPHALDRNRCLYSLANGVFIISCEKERGITWDGAVNALKSDYAGKIYVWENKELPGNMELIARGAIGFRHPNELSCEQLKQEWEMPGGQQLSMF